MIEYSQEEVASWPISANHFMFKLIKTKPDGFTKKDFYQMCVEENIPPSEIKRLASDLFGDFASVGYIETIDGVNWKAVSQEKE
jgi:hypothetical protein